MYCPQVFDHPALQKAKRAVQAGQFFVKREPLFLQRSVFPFSVTCHVFCPFRCTVELLVRLGLERPEWTEHSLFFLMAYSFLLRVPSEAIPVTAGSVGPCMLAREGNFVVLTLARRKNRPNGSRLARGCWCKESPLTCPLCLLSPLLVNAKAGGKLFPNVTTSNVNHVLRSMLAELGIPNAERYRTHDFRRGHAKDLQLAGASPLSRVCSCVFRVSH